MLTDGLPQPYEANVRRAWMRTATRWACRRHRHTIDRSNMNPRGASEKLDDLAMGEIAAISVMQFLDDRGRSVVAYDQVRDDDYKAPDPGWDVAASKNQDLSAWAGGPPEDPTSPPDGAHLLSIKSSRIPEADDDDIDTAIADRDFKVLKTSDRIADDLTADFETQVYYPLADSRLPDDLTTAPQHIARHEVDALIDDLDMEERYGRCYITGFCPSRRIIEHHERLINEGASRTWPSWHAGYEKAMWAAPLRLGISPSRLTDS